MTLTPPGLFVETLHHRQHQIRIVPVVVFLLTALIDFPSYQPTVIYHPFHDATG